MWVREGPNTIVAVAIIHKTKFHYLPHLFQQCHRFINGCQTGEREIGFHPFINLFSTEVFLTIRQYLYDGKSLRSHSTAMLLQLCDNFIQTSNSINHSRSFLLNKRQGDLEENKYYIILYVNK